MCYLCNPGKKKGIAEQKLPPRVTERGAGTGPLFLSEVRGAICTDVSFCEAFSRLERRPHSCQMLQAARSGKQNIVEGLADGITSSEMQLKLLNVARASLKELRADYEDYLLTRHLALWDKQHPRYNDLLKYCRTHSRVADYEPFFDKWNDEELCNTALTLLHMTDKMMKTYLNGLEQQFIAQGGIKERMYAARTGYRKEADEELIRLREENKRLRQMVPVLEQEVERLQMEKRHLEVLLMGVNVRG